MKTKFSPYLSSVKPLLKILLDELLKKYSYVSILASDSTGKDYKVSKSGTDIGTNSFTLERGFVAKVFDSDSYCEYAFSQITNELIPEILNDIETSLVPLKNKLSKDLDYNKYDKLNEETLTFSKSSEFEIDPDAYGDEKIIHELTELHNKGMAYDPRIIDFTLRYEYCQINKLFVTIQNPLSKDNIRVA